MALPCKNPDTRRRIKVGAKKKLCQIKTSTKAKPNKHGKPSRTAAMTAKVLNKITTPFRRQSKNTR